MRLYEIASQSRKIIKKLNRAYLDFTLDESLYGSLTDFINICIQSTDVDVQQAAQQIQNQLSSIVISNLVSTYKQPSNSTEVNRTWIDRF